MMRTSAVVVVGAVVLLTAGAARAQIAWAGAGFGAAWEYQPDSEPDTAWLRGSQEAATLYVAIPIDDNAAVRLAASDIPYEAPFGGEGWPGHFRAYTLGVDYFFPGVFGRAVFSAGGGQYRLDVEASSPPEELTSRDLGWYVGIGEWFQLTRRSMVTAEVTMHRPGNDARPVLVTGLVGVVVSF